LAHAKAFVERANRSGVIEVKNPRLIEAAAKKHDRALKFRRRPEGALKVAILDDYQKVALTMADWSQVTKRAELTVFHDHLSDPDALVERLMPFDALCVMRERTPLPRAIIERLPNLKLIASTGRRNASIEMAAAEERGICVTPTGYQSTATIELTWALILASARHLVHEMNSVRAGGWQTSIGRELSGKTLGVLGLGNIGKPVARIGRAFGMKVAAWSQNLTRETAEAEGATLVSKAELFSQSDVVTIHLVLSARSRGLVGAADLALMKPTSWLVNTSRGPIVDEGALVNALTSRAIAGAALDVFDVEPLPPGHPFRTLDNVLTTPHIGYVAEDLYRIFYGDAAAAIAAWLEERGAKLRD
jgi:phosphoglycerate dehydrogenase-like enzyme